MKVEPTHGLMSSLLLLWRKHKHSFLVLLSPTSPTSTHLLALFEALMSLLRISVLMQSIITLLGDQSVKHKHLFTKQKNHRTLLLAPDKVEKQRTIFLGGVLKCATRIMHSFSPKSLSSLTFLFSQNNTICVTFSNRHECMTGMNISASVNDTVHSIRHEPWNVTSFHNVQAGSQQCRVAMCLSIYFTMLEHFWNTQLHCINAWLFRCLW